MTRICPICLHDVDHPPPASGIDGSPIVSGDWVEFWSRPQNVGAHATCVMEVITEVRKENLPALRRIQQRMRARIAAVEAPAVQQDLFSGAST